MSVPSIALSVCTLAAAGLQTARVWAADPSGDAAAQREFTWSNWPGAEDGRAGFFFVLINFVVLLLILKRVLFKPLIAGNAKKSDAIKEQLARATVARGEAEGLLSDYRNKIERADTEITALLEKARGAAERERQELLMEAAKEADQIVAAAVRTAENEATRAFARLEEEMVDRALDRADAVIRAEFGQTDQQRMVKSYVSQVGAIEPSKLGQVP